MILGPGHLQQLDGRVEVTDGTVSEHQELVDTLPYTHTTCVVLGVH